MSPLQLFETCLGLVARANCESRNGHYVEAKQTLSAAIFIAGGIPAEFVPDLRAAFLYGTLLVQYRNAVSLATHKLRSKAAASLNQSTSSTSSALYQALTFDSRHRLR